MDNINLDLLRTEILSHQAEIKKEMNHSCYFNDFLQIGFLDFFFVSYANCVSLREQEQIIHFLEQGDGWEHFFENFCLQLDISTDQLFHCFFVLLRIFVFN